jgi:hypothetical protein
MASVVPKRVCGIGRVGLILASLAGCGDGQPKPVTVTGKVVYKSTGEPATLLAGGYICLQSVSDPENKPTGRINDDGTFFLGTTVGEKNLGGVTPGEFRVRVVPPQNAAGRTTRGLIEPRFVSFDKSEIRVTIGPDKKELLIEVERPKK